MTPNLLDELEKAAGSRYSEDDVRACAKRMKFYDHQIAASILTEYADRMSSLADMAKRMEAAERDAKRWRAFLLALRTKLHGPGHGNRIKVVEVCPMYGDEKEIHDIAAAIDATQEGAG